MRPVKPAAIPEHFLRVFDLIQHHGEMKFTYISQAMAEADRDYLAACAAGLRVAKDPRYVPVKCSVRVREGVQNVYELNITLTGGTIANQLAFYERNDDGN